METINTHEAIKQDHKINDSERLPFMTSYTLSSLLFFNKVSIDLGKFINDSVNFTEINAWKKISMSTPLLSFVTFGDYLLALMYLHNYYNTDYY